MIRPAFTGCQQLKETAWIALIPKEMAKQYAVLKSGINRLALEGFFRGSLWILLGLFQRKCSLSIGFPKIGTGNSELLDWANPK